MPSHQHLPVTRTARYLTLGPLDEPVGQVWMACHGYGQLAQDFARHLAVLDDGNRLVIVPEGLSRHYVDATTRAVGASWMTREDREHEIADYVAYLDALYAHIAARARRTAGCTLHVLGFSQGAATAARWAVLGTSPPDRLLLWGGDVPPDLDLERARDRLSDARVVLVAGSRDEFVNTAVLLGQTTRLDRHRIRHEVVRFDGGHRLDDATLRELAT